MLEGGLVIDSAFAMPRQHISSFLPQLSAARLTQLRSKWSHLKVIIIDEMSMMSPERLAHLHQRICEIKGLSFRDSNVELFAGLSVLLMGDLFQLPPVKARAIFELPNNPYMAIQDIWKQFKYTELIISERQKKDKTFADMLMRVRTGEQTQQDVQLLKQREVRLQRDHPCYPLNSLHLFASFAKAQEHNEFMLTQLPGDVVCIAANDSNPSVPKRYVPTESASLNRRDTGGLETNLKLKIGCRIMITRNIDTSDGLSNGAVGTLIEFQTFQGEVSMLIIEFDDTRIGFNTKTKTGFLRKKGVPVKKVTITYPHPSRRQVQMQRKQFPVALAWGCTIHKSQGLTLDTVVVDFVKQPHQSFQPGQGYVALSRVRSMETLYVKNFTDKCLKVNERVILEIARLRHANPLRPYCLPSKSSSTIIIMSLNITGLSSSKMDLELDAHNIEVDVLLLQETFLKDDKFSVDNFVCWHFVSPNNRSFSKSILIRSSLTTKVIRRFVDDMFQVVTLSLPNRQLTVISVYRPHAVQTLSFISRLLSKTDEMNADIVMGDFNIQHNDANYEQLAKSLFERNMLNRVNWPTHAAGGSIDFCFVKEPSQYELSDYPVYYSNHNALLCFLRKT